MSTKFIGDSDLMPEQILSTVLDTMGVTIQQYPCSMPNQAPQWAKRQGANAYSVHILRRQYTPDTDGRYTASRKGFHLYYFKGKGLSGEPTREEVLECIVRDRQLFNESDHTLGFYQWAEDLGYDPESVEDYEMFKQLARQTDSLQHLFTVQELDTLDYLITQI